MSFSLINKSRTVLPNTPFNAIKDAALGVKYELSVCFVTSEEIQKLNLQYRNINKPTDILSFPLSKTEGEIYISPKESRVEAKKFDRTYENFISFLFIHGCIHLKGYDHGATMEDIEVKLRKTFEI